MMQAMRDRVKMIYWIVIVTFLGLMFLVWGIGLDGSSPVNANPDLVAKVNGVGIHYNSWQDRYNGILAQLRQQSGENSLTENQILHAREQAFDQLVEETLLQQEAERQGISVSDEEIVDILVNDPPAYLLQYFRDANGQVDLGAYQAALKDPAASASWRQVEESLRMTLPLDKLYQRVATRAVVGEEEVRAAYLEQNSRAVAEYVGVLLSDVDEESSTEISDAEAEAYYQAHLDQYKLPRRARVRAVYAAKTPSEVDEQEVLAILQELRTEIRDGLSSFADVARNYSEDSSAESGGELGWCDRDRMAESFTEAAFALSVGDVSEPVRTEFGYHLITVTDERLDANGRREEVECSHVLVNVTAGIDALVDQRAAFDALHERAQSEGLAAATAETEFELLEPAAFQEDFNIPGVPNSLGGSSFAFSAEPGDLSGVYETNDGYYCVELVEILPEGARPLEEVRSLVVGAVQREKRSDAAAAKLAEAWAQIQSGRSMADVARDNGLAHGVTDTFTYRQNIQEIGFATPFARAAVSMESGEKLAEVRTTRGVFALQVLWRNEFDQADYQAQKAEIQHRLRQDRQRRLTEEWMKELRAAAKIEDLRANLL